MKDNNKIAHQVGHDKLKRLDIDDFFKRKIVVDDLKASSTSTKFEHSDLGMKKNQQLLEEYEEQEFEEANDDSDVNAEANKLMKKTTM